MAATTKPKTAATAATTAAAREIRESRRITSVTLDGFCGHHLHVPLAPVTVLTGPNQCGKTSTRDAISLALSGRIPGTAAPTDSTGMTSVDYLTDCTTPTGKFSVSITDDQGQRASFAFSRSTKGACRRDVTSTLHEGRLNDVHRAAIARRFGLSGGDGGVQMLSLDTEALRRMEPEDLELAIMRLCGGAGGQGYTAHGAIYALVDRVFAGTDTSTSAAWLAALQRFSHDGVAAWIARTPAPSSPAGGDVRDGAVCLGDVPTIREALGELRVLVEASISEALSQARHYSGDAGLAVPAAPSEEEVATLRAEMEKLQEDVIGLAYYAGKIANQIDAADATRSQERKRAKDRVAYAEDEAVRWRIEHRQMSASCAAYPAKIEAERQRLSEAQAALEAAKVTHDENSPDDFLPQAPAQRDVNPALIAARDVAKDELVNLEMAAIDETAAIAQARDNATRKIVSLETHIADLSARLTRAQVSRAMMDGDMARLRERMGHYAEGRCPECGQVADTVVEDLTTTIDHWQTEAQSADALIQDLQAQFAAAKVEMEEARAAVRKADAEIAGILAMVDVARIKASDAQKEFDLDRRYAERQYAADVSEHETRLAAIAANRDTQTMRRVQAESEVANIQASIEQLTVAAAGVDAHCQTTKNALDAAETRLSAAKSELAALESDTSAQQTTEALQASLDKAQAATLNAEAARDKAQAAYEAAQTNRARADAIIARVNAAKVAQSVEQYKGAFWRSARIHLVRLERDILSDFFAPIADPVNQLIAAADATETMGRFGARFGARFQLGYYMSPSSADADGSDNGGHGEPFADPDSEIFVPLSRLSDGQLMVTMAMVSTVIHAQTDTPWRAITIDRVEAVDSATRPMLLGMLSWLVAEDHIDQVILCAVDAQGWGELADGVTVVDLTQCRQ